jgi:EAL domain-containing protein (putative c-di-GMP-specific phosphodiesterase class I)
MPSIRSQPIICLKTFQPIGHELFHSTLRQHAYRSHETIHIHALKDTTQLISERAFNTPIFINVSSRLISESNRFFQQVNNTLEQLKNADISVHLELTEESAAPSFAKRVELLKPLCAQIVMDDFGSLSSNLDRLMQLQPHAVKIDRSLLQTLSPDHPNQGLYPVLLDLFNSLKIEIIAEGIENETQYLWLKNQGVTKGQGYYLEPPRVQVIV